MKLPADFGVCWSEKGGVRSNFRGYSEDRRVIRRMSRRLGLRFSRIKDGWGVYYVMRQETPGAKVTALMEQFG